MSHVPIVVTGCAKRNLNRFLVANEVKKFGIDHDRHSDNLTLAVRSFDLEVVFRLFQDQANRAWDTPDDRTWVDFDEADVLIFDSAFFPDSATRAQPLRHLRGIVAAKLDHKQRELLPASAAPGRIFDGAGGEL